MRRPRLLILSSALLALALSAPVAAALLQDGKGLGPGPQWRGPISPAESNEVFATADGCSMCHSASPNAVALRSPTGDDVSPHGLWRATLMANAFRDPYWRAQVAKECEAAPAQKAEVEALCLRCHAPAAHHGAVLGNLPSPPIADATKSALARDGVNCTVCHQIQPQGLGTEETFAGKVHIGRERAIFGPYPEPSATPMKMHSSYTATHGTHISKSALCGSCHTLHTEHGGARFPEQTPYLEWRNSMYEDETGRKDLSQSCQDCHMPRQGTLRIARNPGGRDFNITPRPDFAAHVFAGGNVFMLELLRANAKELGVEAPDAALERNIQITRRQLADLTTRVTVGEIRRAEGKLEFDVKVENLTGHKFPTGYPSRRAWLHVEVRAGGKVIFRSGASDAAGKLVGVADELAVPHRNVIEKPEEVVVYELVGHDAQGAPTTFLTKMASRGKDTRLLPKGWRVDGPHAEDTKPIGVAGDADFTEGGDVVHFRVPVGADAPRVQVVAWVRYQSVPPAWVEALRRSQTDEAKTFVRMYDAADRSPEVAGLGARSEGN